jgi:hypothetical protein
VPQGSTTNELRAAARKHWTYFKYGTSSPGGTMLAKVGDAWGWVAKQFGLGVEEAKKKAGEAETKAKEEL